MSAKTILFLCSGGGGNLRFVHRALENGWLPRWSRIAVIADRECRATEYARQESLAITCIDFSANEQNDLLDAILPECPDVIITTVHRILRTPLLTAYTGRLLNLHYSLLPAFSGAIGASPVKSAMDYGVCLVGASVHLVTESLDGGQPQVQAALAVSRDDNLSDVMDVVFRAGCIALYTALKNRESSAETDWRGASLRIKGRDALINPSIKLPDDLALESFWQTLK